MSSEYYEKNREKVLRQTKVVAKRNKEFRNNLLAQFPCLICNESDHDLIDWHHVYPDDKLFNIGQTSRSHSEWWDEVLKCIPLCALCHRKLHKNKLCLISPTASRRPRAIESISAPAFTCRLSRLSSARQRLKSLKQV